MVFSLWGLRFSGALTKTNGRASLRVGVGRPRPHRYFPDMTAPDRPIRADIAATDAVGTRRVGAVARIPNNMLALGSAAVLSVYAVGYLRTKSAADKFDSQFGDEHESRRRPAAAPTSSPPEDRPGIAMQSADTSGLARHGVRDSAAMPTNDGRAVRVVTQASPTTSVSQDRASAAHDRVIGKTAVPASDRPSSTTTAAAVSGIAATATAASTASDAPPAPAINASMYSTGNTATPRTPTTTATPVPPTPDSVKTAAVTTAAAAAPAEIMPKVPLRDGSYVGYGTSRHGDIEATVVVENGRIKSAAISRCLTRYSCSWIAHLRGQVVTRQSPEVDYVSGATESTNAFYYAVVEALTKAQ